MRRFGYEGSALLGGAPPRVVSVGISGAGERGSSWRAAFRGFEVDWCQTLSAAALHVALGEHEVLLVHLGRVTGPAALEFVDAVRRYSRTCGMAIIGVGGSAAARAAFLEAGADAAARDERAARAMVKWTIGGAALPREATTRLAAAER